MQKLQSLSTCLARWKESPTLGLDKCGAFISIQKAPELKSPAEAADMCRKPHPSVFEIAILESNVAIRVPPLTDLLAIHRWNRGRRGQTQLSLEGSTASGLLHRGLFGRPGSPRATCGNRTSQQRAVAGEVIAAQESSVPASNSTTSEAISELRSWKKRGQKRNIWTVNHVEGTKLRMNKRRRPSYRPEDQEAFYRLLEDPAIQSFLEADIFLKVSDKYLLSMVVEYFGRVGLPGHLYNRIHFFLALYIASDMEEDNPTSKRSIFQFLLGREHWPDLYKEFLKLKVEFFHAMGHRAWVTPELCEEIQAQNPHHWVWSRVRQCAP
ncbi:PREDICTED: speedy protein E4-like [Odobenus rosmarus divergens]|uniref:Speedy protein E4-like n=1 Tax=Odobenus rosmarus divergens TaxID=9708 RepID=A0A2U3VWV2_ODORO|nr:PREDICTED: speedy protein E4-like [Odobenus rosmarus divergens]